MVEHHRVAVAAPDLGEHDHAVRRGVDHGSRGLTDVDAGMEPFDPQDGVEPHAELGTRLGPGNAGW